MKPILPLCVAASLVLGLIAMAQAGTAAPDISRYSHTGDGWISFTSKKNGKSFTGRYRLGRGNYNNEAIEAINRVFGAPNDNAFSGISLRLIEFLDLLEDRFSRGADIVILSGYRNPDYNTRLRNQGALAAEASLHQYGMAADLKMYGVPARRIWDYVKDMGFGGAGYYHDESVHVDVGPARSWDEKTSGVGTDISSDNKLIGLVTDYDVYLPGETLTMMFIRMTAFPIGVMQEFSLDCQTGSDSSDEAITFRPSFSVSSEGPCPQFNDIRQMGSIRWQLPEKLPAGQYKIRARFCNCTWDGMPNYVSTPEFEIVRPEAEP